MKNIIRVHKLKSLNCKANNILTSEINGFTLCDIREEINHAFVMVKHITSSGFCKGYQIHLGYEKYLKDYKKFIKMQNTFLDKLKKINMERRKLRIKTISRQYTIFN